MVNKLSTGYKALREAVGEDLESLESKLISTKTCLGSVPPKLGFDDCILAWDGLALMQGKVEAAARFGEQALQSMTQMGLDLDSKMLSLTQTLDQWIEVKIKQSLVEFQTSLTGVVEVVRLLGMGQEKLTERILAQAPGTHSSSALSRKVRELRDLVFQNNRQNGHVTPTLNTLQAELRLLEACLPFEAKS
jgi:hypothetical protein